MQCRATPQVLRTALDLLPGCSMAAPSFHYEPSRYISRSFSTPAERASGSERVRSPGAHASSPIGSGYTYAPRAWRDHGIRRIICATQTSADRNVNCSTGLAADEAQSSECCSPPITVFPDSSVHCLRILEDTSELVPPRRGGGSNHSRGPQMASVGWTLSLVRGEAAMIRWFTCLLSSLHAGSAASKASSTLLRRCKSWRMNVYRSSATRRSHQLRLDRGYPFPYQSRTGEHQFSVYCATI
ncbi:hypothetical protein C8Q80DRAFT_589399 [Daedaleopsis nitida]|nr:hypothetical protein C8Q80DRAFT_589399 [Daedaleopsis nitida]